MTIKASVEMFNSRNYWLGCTFAQVLSFYKSQGLPVELTYFNSLDDLDEIFLFVKNNIERFLYIRETRVRMEYKPWFVDNMGLLGIRVTELSPGDFAEVEEKVISHMDNGGLLLMTTQTFYLPHHLEFYQKKLASGFHTIILTQYNSMEEEYTLYDDSKDFKSYIPFVYHKSIVRDTFNHSSRRIYMLSQENRENTLSAGTSLEKFTAWLDQCKERIPGSLTDFIVQNRNDQNYYLILNNTFAVARGTRELFHQYLTAQNAPKELSDLLLCITEALLTLENVSMKSHIKKDQVDLEKWIPDIQALQKDELELVRGLKLWAKDCILN